MPKPAISDALSRAATRPAEAHAELTADAEEIEAGLAATPCHLTEAELAGIDRGLADARAGRFATNQQVAQVFARHRRL
jgi:predicted transcriptional regulator